MQALFPEPLRLTPILPRIAIWCQEKSLSAPRTPNAANRAGKAGLSGLGWVSDSPNPPKQPLLSFPLWEHDATTLGSSPRCNSGRQPAPFADRGNHVRVYDFNGVKNLPGKQSSFSVHQLSGHGKVDVTGRELQQPLRRSFQRRQCRFLGHARAEPAIGNVLQNFFSVTTGYEQRMPKLPCRQVALRHTLNGDDLLGSH